MTAVNQVGNTLTGSTGTGTFVGANTPTLITPVIGAATGTSLSVVGPILANNDYIASGSVAGGNAGIVAVYSPTASRGIFQFKAADMISNYNVTVINAAYNQTSVLTVPDVGAATGKFIMSTGSGQTIGAGLTITSPSLVTPTLGAASATSLTFTSTSGIIGTTTNDSAAAGSVGELVAAGGVGSPVNLTTATSANVTSISLTAGDWDVWGNLFVLPDTTTNVTIAQGGISSTTATLPTLVSVGIVNYGAAGVVPSTVGFNYQVPGYRLSLSATTTIYLVANVAFSLSTCQAGGAIYARRRR